MTDTIFVGHQPGTYKAYYGLGPNGQTGWYVMFLDKEGNSRTVDGGQMHTNRQNAYAKAARLNASLQPIQYYTRNIDAGSGRQNVTVKDGIITHQELVARQGYYTGDGNPELVGRPVKALRGMGFRKVKGPQVFNSFTGKWSSLDEPEYELTDNME